MKSFKTIEFNNGFNFLVSCSINGKSNNGTGKTSLIQIMNFCLCSSSEKLSNYEELNNEEFSVDIEIDGKEITLSRNFQTPTKIKIIDRENVLGLGNIMDESKSVEQVKNQLDKVFFNMNENEITFRNLISPFMKRGAYAFNHIFKTHAMEPNIITQLKNSYLMNIPITHILELKKLIEEREIFLKLKEIKETDIIWKKEKINTLKQKIKELNGEIDDLEKVLKNFELNTTDKRMLKRLNEINKNLSKLIKNKYANINNIEANKEIILKEELLSIEQIKTLMNEAKFFISGRLEKRLEDVQQYHERLYKYRNERILEFSNQLEKEINQIDEQIELLNEEKTKILKVFNKNGYLDDYYNSNEILTEKKIERSSIQKQLDVYKELNNIDQKCKEKSDQIMEEMKKYHNCKEFISISDKFSEYINIVFNEKAKLIMDFKPNVNYYSKGYYYDWEIPKKLSSGYLKGCIAVYDLVMCYFNASRFPIFLIHDSVIFESTDKNYVAKFLNLAYKISKEENFQYICCVNDDQVVKEFLIEELIKLYNVAPRLSQEDTLFGIEFGKR